MTAEISIMNREAIALAADSAVTSAGPKGNKIFTSANKLFALSKHQPVGIMVFGNALFMGVPWETIIKVYREKLGQKLFRTLGGYSEDFIDFLENRNSLFPDMAQDKYVQDAIYNYFSFIKQEIVVIVQDKFEKNKDCRVSEDELKKIVSDKIQAAYETWEKAHNIPSIPKSFNRKILKKYKKVIDKVAEKVFEKLPVSEQQIDKLRKIAASYFSKFPLEKEDISGIVIAGFGDDDTFPSLQSFRLECVVKHKLKYTPHISGDIHLDNASAIIPFAQKEMVGVFMEGSDYAYRAFENGYLKEIFDHYAGIIVDSMEMSTDQKNKLKEKLKIMNIGNKLLEDFGKKTFKYRREKYISPVMATVSMLPKEELAAMAESLVNLQSFKRKFTLESETVGGPIDVAVISKGDGFIWVKKKDYFKSELNPQFFMHKYGKV